MPIESLLLGNLSPNGAAPNWQLSADISPFDGTADWTAILKRNPSVTTGKIITFPEGVFMCSDFQNDSYSYQAGITIPKWVRGIVGSGRGTLGGTDGTIFTMKAGSSTRAPLVPASNSSNPTQLNLWKHYPDYPVVYRNFQVAGTEQGHVFHALQVVNAPDGSVVEDVLLSGWAGNQGYPPGETFGAQVSGGSNHVFRRVEADGRRVVGGPVYGAVGLTFQSGLNCLFDLCSLHHLRAATVVFYQCINSRLRDCFLDSSSAGAYAIGGGGINLERTAGTILERPTIIGRAGKPHITHSNDFWVMNRGGASYSVVGGSLTIIDPIIPVEGRISPDNPRCHVQTWSPYGQGKYTIGPNGALPPYATAVANGYTGTQAEWEKNATANSMTYPGAAGSDPGSGPNNGPDTSPRVYAADGTPIAYTWIFADVHRILLRGPATT